MTTPAGTAPIASSPCLCGSGTTYSSCCGPLISGLSTPVTARALMRSRYTAYVLGLQQYILSTWSPESRPADVDVDTDGITWLGLQIHGYGKGEDDDSEGSVDFSATYLLGGCFWTMRENSRFQRIAGKWYYVDGEGRSERLQVERNSPCPCGSGKKFKRCCR